MPGGIRFWGEVLGIYDRSASTCVLISQNIPVMWGSDEEAGSENTTWSVGCKGNYRAPRERQQGPLTGDRGRFGWDKITSLKR